jgi:hypothetical protein
MNRPSHWLRGVGAATAIAAAGLAASGCGGQSTHAAATTAVTIRPIATTPAVRCKGSPSAAARSRARRRLHTDLRRLAAAVKTMKHYAQDGNAATNAALDRFQVDVAADVLPIHERSRMIDHAAAIVSPKCYLCFQALESNRPIAGGAKLACG